MRIYRSSRIGSLAIVEIAPQTSDGDPANDDDGNGESDLFQSMYSRRVEFEGVVVVECTGVVGGESKRFHVQSSSVVEWSSCPFHCRHRGAWTWRSRSASRNADDEVETLDRSYHHHHHHCAAILLYTSLFTPFHHRPGLSGSRHHVQRSATDVGEPVSATMHAGRRRGSWSNEVFTGRRTCREFNSRARGMQRDGYDYIGVQTE